MSSVKWFYSCVEYFVDVWYSISFAYRLYLLLGILFIIYLLGSRYMANQIVDTIEPCGTLCLS